MTEQISKRQQEIFNTIRPWLAEKLGVDPSEVTMGAHLEEALGADSLDKAEMPFDLEDMFGVDINAHFDEYPDNYIRTVVDMVTLVEKLQNGNDSSNVTQTKNTEKKDLAVLWLAVSNQKRTNSTGMKNKLQKTK